MLSKKFAYAKFTNCMVRELQLLKVEIMALLFLKEYFFLKSQALGERCLLVIFPKIMVFVFSLEIMKY